MGTPGAGIFSLVLRSSTDNGRVKLRVGGKWYIFVVLNRASTGPSNCVKRRIPVWN